jgi:hypothetical protein
MRTTIRLMVKSLRFEIVAMSVAVIVLGCVALYIAWRLGQVGIPRECLFSNLPIPYELDYTLEATCQATRDQFYELVNTGGQVLAMTVLIPCVAGLLIGVPLVARELESGTASLAWTLSRSRWIWYLRRVIPLAVIVGLALLLPAAATVIMQGARQPDVDPWASFSDGSLRGPVVLCRGLLAMGIGVLAGAVVGRQLPAVIIGGLLAILVIGFVVSQGVQTFSAALGEWRTSGQTTSGDLVLDIGYRDKSSGAIVGYDTAYGGAPILPDGGSDETWVQAHFDQVILAVPGWRYPEVTGAESAALGGLAVLALGLGGLVVDRRRPS